MEYNRGQRNACRQIIRFLADPNELLFFLLGYPGTGKTMLIADIIRDFLQDEEMTVMICAPTHKALGVIKSQIARLIGPDLQGELKFATLHSFFGMSPVISCEDGARVFASKAKPKESEGAKKKKGEIPNLIVIDECSMISESMAAVIKQYQETNHVKAIVMGDQDQINPVKESCSVVFDWAASRPTWSRHLTEIMRTDVSSIKEATAAVREWDYQDQEPLFRKLAQLNKGANTAVYRAYNKGDSKNARWFRRICAMIDQGEAPTIIAWRNNTCASHNRSIRQHLHGTNQPEPFLPGDLMVFNNQYEQTLDPEESTPPDPKASKDSKAPKASKDPKDRKESEEPQGSFKFFTSDMARIVSRVIKTEKLGANWTSINTTGNTPMRRECAKLVRALAKEEVPYQIAYLEMIPVVSGGIPVSSKKNPTAHLIKTIYPDSEAEYQERCNYLQKSINQFWSKHHNRALTESLWNIYYQSYVDQIADVCYGYSITAHKSQGSTFIRVIVDAQDIAANQNRKEMRSILLTAISRPSASLIVLL